MKIPKPKRGKEKPRFKAIAQYEQEFKKEYREQVIGGFVEYFKKLLNAE